MGWALKNKSQIIATFGALALFAGSMVWPVHVVPAIGGTTGIQRPMPPSLPANPSQLSQLADKQDALFDHPRPRVVHVPVEMAPVAPIPGATVTHANPAPATKHAKAELPSWDLEPEDMSEFGLPMHRMGPPPPPPPHCIAYAGPGFRPPPPPRWEAGDRAMFGPPPAHHPGPPPHVMGMSPASNTDRELGFAAATVPSHIW